MDRHDEKDAEIERLIDVVHQVTRQRDDLLAALAKAEARLTACARAFYGDGKRSSLAAAFEGWKADIEPARAAILKATGGGA